MPKLWFLLVFLLFAVPTAFSIFFLISGLLNREWFFIVSSIFMLIYIGVALYRLIKEVRR